MAAETKAIAALEKLKLPFELLRYDYDPSAGEIGMHAARAIGIAPHLVLKCLMVETPDQPIVALVPSDRQLNLKSLASAAKVKTCAMMDKAKAQRITGYVIGGVSPLGQKRSFATYIDDSVKTSEFVICNGGKRGLQIKIAPQDLALASKAIFALLC